MLLDSILAILAVFRTFVTILLPAVNVHNVTTLGNDRLPGQDLLTAIVAYPVGHIRLRDILFIVLDLKSLRAAQRDKNLHYQEEQADRQQSHQKSDNEFQDSVRSSRRTLRPRFLRRPDGKILLSHRIPLPFCGETCLS